MLSSGVTHCVMEVSSHSIEQKRISDAATTRGSLRILRPNISIITAPWKRTSRPRGNFSATTTRSPGAASVVNIDDKWGAMLCKEAENPLGYSIAEKTDIYPKEYSITSGGIKAVLATPKGDVYVNSPFIGGV